jgi:hypothetical protein
LELEHVHSFENGRERLRKPGQSGTGVGGHGSHVVEKSLSEIITLNKFVTRIKRRHVLAPFGPMEKSTERNGCRHDQSR